MDTRHRAAELTMALAQYETPKQRVAFRLPARTIDTDKTDMPDKGGDEGIPTILFALSSYECSK